MNNKTVSLFSGGGGLDLGFKQAGYDIVWAIDSNQDAVNTYKRNVGSEIMCGDITAIDINNIPKADIVIGGPPCQSFSLAGKRQCDDERGRLVWRYLDIIKHVSPKAFLFENVAGLISAKDNQGHKILDGLLNTFEEAGYHVSWQLVNAADYGVPQLRKRVIIVGLKDGQFVFPVATHNDEGTDGKKKYVSVEDAIGDLPMAGTSGIISEHDYPTMSKLDQYICSHVKPGGNYMDIPDEVPSVRIKRLKQDGGHTTCYGRMTPNKPAYTINTYFNRPNVGCNIHYKHDRIITIINSQFEGCILPKKKLEQIIDNGWQIGNMSKKDAQNFILTNIASSRLLTTISESKFKDYMRGKIGNDGCTDLLYMKPTNPFLTKASKQLKGHLSAGLNNAKFDSVNIGEGESLFFNVNGMTDLQIRRVVKLYLDEDCGKSKKQRRDKKTLEEYVSTLKKESKRVSPAHCVMLPRTIRSNGRVFVSDRPTFVSTNFFIIKADERHAKILASWFSTIFYQLECEAYCNNRAGARKMEEKDYNPLHVPITSELSENEKKRIVSTPINEFINLRSPRVREVDRVWAEILFGENAEKLIEEALALVPVLVADREK